MPDTQSTEGLQKRTEQSSPVLDPQHQEIQAVVAEIVQPLFEHLSKIFANNAEALEQIAAAQALQADRLDGIEKQIRLQTPMTSKQAYYINESIRNRARELLDRFGLSDNKKAVSKLSSIIRRSVQLRYGVSCIREIPKYEYSVVMSQVSIYQNAVQIKDVVKEARRYEKTDLE